MARNGGDIASGHANRNDVKHSGQHTLLVGTGIFIRRLRLGMIQITKRV
jgi:hypothetical protein